MYGDVSEGSDVDHSFNTLSLCYDFSNFLPSIVIDSLVSRLFNLLGRSLLKFLNAVNYI